MAASILTVRTGASAPAVRDHDIARLQIVFGAGFAVAGGLTSAFAATVPSLFASSATLLGASPCRWAADRRSKGDDRRMRPGHRW
jgi:hypothetical protein